MNIFNSSSFFSKYILTFSILNFGLVCAHELDYSSKDVRKIYGQVLKAFSSKHQGSPHYIKLKSADGRTFKIEEGKFQSIVRESLKLNIDIILKNCSANIGCDVKAVEKKAIGNFNELLEASIKKVKHVSHEVKDFIMDMLWDTVTGTRRYGILYLSLVVTGEVIEHAVIHPLGVPIPLCKFVQAGTVKILDSVKQNLLTLFSRYPVPLNLSERIRLVFSNYQYRKNFHRHIQRFLTYTRDPSKMSQSFFKKVKALFAKSNYFDDIIQNFDLSEYDKLREKVEAGNSIKLSKKTKVTQRYMQKFKIARDIESMNFLLDTNEVYLKALHEEGKLSTKKYIQAKWNLGHLGASLDSYRAQVIALESLDRLKYFKSSHENLLFEFTQAMKGFTENPTDLKNNVKFKNFSEGLKKFKRNQCYGYFLNHAL